MKKRVHNYAMWVIKYRWLVIFASVALAMLIGAGAKNIVFNNDYRVFFGDDNPQLLAFDALQDKYTKNDNVYIVIEPESGNVFERNTLTALEELTVSSWQTPYSFRVDALSNFQYTHAEGDDMYVEDLATNVASKTNAEIENIKTVALNDPLIINRLVNHDGSLTAINISVTLPGESMNETAEVAEHTRKMVAEWQEKHPEFKVYLSGMMMMNQSMAEVTQGDMASLIPLMFLIILFAVIFTTRSISGTISSFLVLIFSIVAAMGFSGWMGMELTGVTGAVPTMVMTLAIADSIHILITLLHEMRQGKSKREAIVESLKVNFRPVFITSITTAIGFLTMNLSDSPPFHDLGNMTAVGVMAAFWFSVTLFPAVLAVLPIRIKVKAGKKDKGEELIERISNFVVQNQKRILWISTVAILGMSAYAARNIIDNDFVKFFSTDVPFRQDSDFINDNISGIYLIEYSLGADGEDGISNPEYLQKLKEFKEWWLNQEYVVHVNSFHEIGMRTNRSMHGDDESFYRIPDNKQEAAQFLLLYEMSLPYGLDLNNQINVDKSETRFTITLENIRSGKLIELAERGEQWLSQNAPDYMFAHGISTPLMFSHLGIRQADSMISGTTLAILLISLILVFALRSFKFGVLSLVPNILPLTVAFGVWAMIDGMVTMGITVVFGMTMGIIVDDTVHFLTKYIRGKREHGLSAEKAVHYAFATTGRAIVVTTIILVAGFMVLAQSDFAMNSGMGKLTAITVAVALIIDFLMLPALLLFIDKKSAPKVEPSFVEVS